MTKIIISSKNPVKIESTIRGFKEMFPGEKYSTEGVSVISGVSDQPMTEADIFKGALNRVNNASKDYPDADFWVGIEGGIEILNDEMLTFAWVFIKNKEKIGKGRSASFFLSKKVSDLIKQGKELGDADDIVFGKNNSKQQNGATGLLTDDIITRTDLYTHAVIMALIPFKNPNLY